MKFIYYLGLSIFIIGIILFFIRQFKPEFLPTIDDLYIDIMWPIGMLIYGSAQLGINAQKKKNMNR